MAGQRLDAQLLQTSGAVSFAAYGTAGGTKPDMITILEFQTIEDARNALLSEQLRMILEGLRTFGAAAEVVVVERSPFMPEPIRAASA
jgi:hypothetical protein